MTGRKDSDKVIGYGTNSFTIHGSQVCQQKSEDLVYFALNISIETLFALKPLQNSNVRICPFFFSQLYLHSSQLDITVI